MIVAIHGAEDPPAQWEPMRDLLLGEELFAWAAPTALDVDYRPSGMAELVAGAFTGSAALLGFSWGASVAARFAAAHPERVEALVLVEGAHVDFRHLDGYEPPAATRPSPRTGSAARSTGACCRSRTRRSGRRSRRARTRWC